MHCKKFRPRPLPSLRNMEFRVQMTASGQIGASGRPKMREGGDTESIPCRQHSQNQTTLYDTIIMFTHCVHSLYCWWWWLLGTPGNMASLYHFSWAKQHPSSKSGNFLEEYCIASGVPKSLWHRPKLNQTDRLYSLISRLLVGCFVTGTRREHTVFMVQSHEVLYT